MSITSPNYPAAYDYHTKCGWLLKPTSRKVVVTMSCQVFDLEGVNNAGECSDFLKIQRMKYCGSGIPQSIIATNITRFKVIFKTNQRGNYKGFQCTVKATNPNTDHCSCGISGKTTSVSEKVEPGEFPWQAALVAVKEPATPFCGASVIHESWVLTSATCAHRMKYNKYNYEVVVGGHIIDAAATRLVHAPVRRILIHPRYHPDVTENNVALVHLKEALTFSSDGVLPVCLPHPLTNYTTHTAILAGWGAETGTSPVLRKVAVRIMTEADCTLLHHRHTDIVTAFCAAPVNATHRPPCEADLGGPLVVHEGSAEGAVGRYVQVGVAAHSDGCKVDNPRLPGVYTDLAPFLHWINKTIGPGNTCH
ncbi:serine protease 33-like [Cherax quadricarinatus]|uniref:serine protease 33-like n=1 Tax=Cherax quadricarinatus TaxID=27406 RepID=UPI00387E770F